MSVSILACTQQKPESTLKSDADIFSNRPIGAVPDVFVVTLDAPALLSVAEKSATGWQISDEMKSAVNNEQAAFEQKLKTVSPDAQIVYRYKLVLNGLAVYAPAGAVEAIRGIAGVKSISPVRQMARAEILNEQRVASGQAKKNEVNSANYIGTEAAYAQGFRGQGMRVGILDTGIDYTHSMLGGSGLKADYEAIKPAEPSALFPNAKVAGGIDLVGTEFNANSAFAAMRLPHPDGNPLDEAGHGTHVAGTVAGKGDGVNSYDGVAPDAQVYAVKVFGKDGSTMDAVVIAGFEYAADPNGDLNPDDQLDVVNLSLGGGFGQPQILYGEAVRNLSRAGTVVVASAGNSGPIDYIVGAPGTSDDAISIAASVDGSLHNWQFNAVRFVSPNNPNWMAKALEGPVSKPIAEIAPTEGELVDIGLADVDLSEEVKAKVAGKVALIVRGKVPFEAKLVRAFNAGAIGAVVYNNEAGKPIPMGGETKVDMPAIMVSQALGLKLVSEMALGPVRVQFKTGQLIEEPELIDSITDFSSKGPRSEDNLLKPELAAPGQRVISAAMGQGSGTVQMDGTSMAAPHVSGVMALLKQARPTLSAAELKALAMETSKVLTNAGGEVSISLQGAGRVQIDKALATPVVVQPASLSLGSIYLENASTVVKKLTVRNISTGAVTLDLSTVSTPGLTLSLSKTQVELAAGASAEVEVSANISISDEKNFVSELNGRVYIKNGAVEVAQVPALAIRTLVSNIRTDLTNAASGSITLTNASPADGMALAFNLLGEDARKRVAQPSETWKSRNCDLQSAGYRIIPKTTRAGVKDVVQFAFKMHTPLTTWHMCEVSVLIDANEDGVPDQELAGVSAAGIEGFQVAPFATALLDAAKARAIRLQYEADLAAGTESKLSYLPAMLAAASMAPFEHSSLAVIEMPLERLAKTADGKLNVKLASITQGGDAIEADDYLGEGLSEYTKIESSAQALPYYGMSEFSAVPKTGGALTLSKGSGTGKLVIYYPLNGFNSVMDTQSQIID